MQAGILVIGDEILSGHTQDTNSGWLAKRLDAIGSPVVEVRVVGDEAARIQGSVWELQERRECDVVVACGGLGPTHDDRTMAAVAALHGVPLVRDATTYEWLRSRHERLHKDGRRASVALDAASEKMCLVPAGAEVYENEAGAAPGVLTRRRTSAGRAVWTVVLPGVPQELQTLWSTHLGPRLERLVGTSRRQRTVKELLYRGFESEAAATVAAVATEHADVAIGSYPHWGRREVVLRVTGTDAAAVEAATAALAQAMHADGHDVAPHVRQESRPNP